MPLAEVSAMVSEWRRSPERITRWVAFMDRIRTAEEDGLGTLVGRLAISQSPQMGTYAQLLAEAAERRAGG